MKITPLHAKRQMIPPVFFAVAEIDQTKVAKLVAHLRAGGTVPPVVVALYGAQTMPLNGHHRMAAFAELGWQVDAWTVSGRAFDTLDSRLTTADNGKRAEDYVLCDGVPAMLTDQ